MFTIGSKYPVLQLSDDVLQIGAGSCAATVPARETPDTTGRENKSLSKGLNRLKEKLLYVC